MLQYVSERIENIEADVIVNAANAKGYMGGTLGRFVLLKGVAESIHYNTKGEVEKEAKSILKKRKLSKGNVFVTSGGSLGVPIIHAITVNKPGAKSDIGTVETCVRNLVNVIDELGCGRVAIPFLGTGIGKVNKYEVTYLYDKYLKNSSVIYLISDPFNKE